MIVRERERERERESLHNVIQLTSSTGSRGRGSVWSDRSPSHCLLGCRRHPLHNTNTDRQMEHLFTEYVPSICIYTMLIDTCHVRTCAHYVSIQYVGCVWEWTILQAHTHTHSLNKLHTQYTHQPSKSLFYLKSSVYVYTMWRVLPDVRR